MSLSTSDFREYLAVFWSRSYGGVKWMHGPWAVVGFGTLMQEDILILQSSFAGRYILLGSGQKTNYMVYVL